MTTYHEGDRNLCCFKPVGVCYPKHYLAYPNWYKNWYAGWICLVCIYLTAINYATLFSTEVFALLTKSGWELLLFHSLAKTWHFQTIIYSDGTLGNGVSLFWFLFSRWLVIYFCMFIRHSDLFFCEMPVYNLCLYFYWFIFCFSGVLVFFLLVHINYLNLPSVPPYSLFLSFFPP